MSHVTAELADPGSGMSIATVDAWANATATLAAGDVLPFPSSSIASATLPSTSTASAAQRKSATVCVALEPGVSGQRIRVRLQGRVKALVKSTANSAISIGDRLCFGTAKALEADAPTVNTNRWVAYADEAVAAGASSSAALKDVILVGPNGLGMQASGA